MTVKTELAADNPLHSGLPAQMRLSLFHTVPRISLLSPRLKTVEAWSLHPADASSQLACEAFQQNDMPAQLNPKTNRDRANPPPSNPQGRVQSVTEEKRHRLVRQNASLKRRADEILRQGAHAYSIPHPSAFYVPSSSSHPHPLPLPSAASNCIHYILPALTHPPLIALIAYLFATHPHTHPATHPI
jgi:hypothetical protein